MRLCLNNLFAGGQKCLSFYGEKTVKFWNNEKGGGGSFSTFDHFQEGKLIMFDKESFSRLKFYYVGKMFYLSDVCYKIWESIHFKDVVLTSAGL